MWDKLIQSLRLFIGILCIITLTFSCAGLAVLVSHHHPLVAIVLVVVFFSAIATAAIQWMESDID